MLSYARGQEIPLIEEPIGAVLAKTARKHADNLAVVVRRQNVRWTWRELREHVDTVARGLVGVGLSPGDRVGVWATNCAEWLLLQLGCARAGVVLVNVNPAYRSHELHYVLAKSRMSALFLHEEDQRANYRSILEQSEAPATLKHTFYLGSEDWDRFLANGRELPDFVPAVDDVANIQYTSGTTGNPKGVLLTHRNLLNNGQSIAICLDAGPADRICSPVPLYHCFGCVIGVMVCLVSGAALLLPSPQFDAKAALETVHEERATALYGVPTMFIAELEHPEFSRFDLTSLRTGVMAGSPCPVEVMRRVTSVMHCRELTIAYGLTEASPVITMSRVDDDLERRVSTVGAVTPNAEVKIINPETGETVPVGEHGELCTRGYLVMKGYDQEPEATARAVDADGWLHTGDLAAMRPDGYFRITGRAKDMIIRGGESIFPREIEEFLYTHPKISDVSVIGIPHARLGEMVGAWIILKNGHTATADEIREFCRGKIAYFKIPEVVRFVSAFPMTVTGKIQKYKMRETEITERNLERVARTETA